VTDNFIEQGGRLDGGVCQAEGAGCDLQEGRQEREISALSLMNLPILSLSEDKFLQTCSPLSLLERDRQGWQWREGR